MSQLSLGKRLDIGRRNVLPLNFELKAFRVSTTVQSEGVNDFGMWFSGAPPLEREASNLMVCTFEASTRSKVWGFSLSGFAASRISWFVP
jgi:hypothetical protein